MALLGCRKQLFPPLLLQPLVIPTIWCHGGTHLAVRELTVRRVREHGAEDEAQE